MYPHDNIFNIYYNIGKRTPFLVKRCELGLARSSSEERRIDPNRDRTFLVETVKPRGKYGKAYGKCFMNGKPDDTYRKECYPNIKDEEIPCAGCGEWVLIDVPGVSLDEIFPIHKADEILMFGKYKGKSLGDIYKMDYQYLYWLETTDRLFKIDFKELKRLYPNVEKTLDISISERIIDFGKYKGQKFGDIKDDISYLEWLVSIGKISIEVFTCKKLLMTKKKLPVRFTGQHFTIDKVLIKDAIRQANISNQDTVLDIGAGKGFLTVHLLKIANNVVAIENDTALVEHLRKLFSDARNVQVVGCDFRNFAVPKFPFKVVSNIPYGITSDIFKILMFESLGNFLGGSIVLQLEPTQKLFSRKLYNPYTVFYHTFFDLKLVYEVGPESFLPPPTVKSALLNIKRKHLFFDFKFKAKYLAFISCLLEKPDLSVKTALKSIFRKSQVRSISEKFGLNLNAQIVCLSPSQWLNCFLEMLEVVPEKFHPS